MGLLENKLLKDIQQCTVYTSNSITSARVSLSEVWPIKSRIYTFKTLSGETVCLGGALARSLPIPVQGSFLFLCQRLLQCFSVLLEWTQNRRWEPITLITVSGIVMPSQAMTGKVLEKWLAWHFAVLCLLSQKTLESSGREEEGKKKKKRFHQRFRKLQCTVWLSTVEA